MGRVSMRSEIDRSELVREFENFNGPESGPLIRDLKCFSGQSFDQSFVSNIEVEQEFTRAKTLVTDSNEVSSTNTRPASPGNRTRSF